MEFVPPTIEALAKLPIAIIAFLLPGWLLTRRVSVALPVVAAFVGSAAILLNLVLLLDAFHVPLHVGTVGAGLALISGLLAWSMRGRPATAIPRRDLPRLEGIEWFWLLGPTLALISIVARAVIDPISGFDNLFRWDYLARLM